MDYYFFRRNLYTIQYIFEYDGHLDAALLESHLQKAVKIFPAVGARMQFVSDKEVVFETGGSIAMTKTVLPAEFANLSPENVATLVRPINNTAGEPLLSVHVTFTPKRSFIGFSFSHMLGDGKSTFQFLTELSNLCVKGAVDSTPFDAREILLLGDGEFHGRASDELFAATGYVLPKPPAPPSQVLETIHYSNSDLETLRADFSRRGIAVSRNDIIMADLAKKFHTDIPLHEGKFIIRCPVDYRGIFGLPENYFGNAIRDAVAVFEPDVLEEMKLEDVAIKIRQAIAGVDSAAVRNSLQCLNALREQEGFNVFEDVGCPGLIVTNWTKFPIPKMDFGIGAPQNFYHASINPRLAIILPASNGVEVRFKRPQRL
jgi:hypothetical protein